MAMQPTYVSNPSLEAVALESIADIPLAESFTAVVDNIVPIQVVTLRDRYQCCHIRFADSQSGEFYPAIFFENDFYSLSATTTEEYAAFKAAMHLTNQGRSTVITKIPKGFAVWVLEPDALPSSRSKLRSTATSPSPQTELPCKVLTAADQHQLCRIQLPQMKEPCLSVRVSDRYYKFFRTVETPKMAAKLVKLLAHYNEQSVITKMPKGYGIWRLIDTAAVNMPTKTTVVSPVPQTFVSPR